MKNLFLFALLSFALTSCISNTAMQTGRVLEKGKVQITAGTSNSTYKIKEEPSSIFSSLDIEDDDNVGGSIDILGRVKVGLGHNTDIGIGLSLGNVFFGSGEIELKHQLIGNQNSKFALSAGLKYNFQNYFGIRLNQLTVPVYASYHLNDKLAFYSSPRFVQMRTSDENLNYFGIVNGINLSVNNVDFYLENGIMENNKNRIISTTIGTAIRI